LGWGRSGSDGVSPRSDESSKRRWFLAHPWHEWARANGVNANQVFGWRRLYVAGSLGERKPGIKLLPVRVSGGELAPAVAESVGTRLTEVMQSQPGMIHVELNRAQVRIEAGADPALVRVLLECLRA